METQKEREGSRDSEKERRPRVWGQRPGEGDRVTQRGIQSRRAETQGGGLVAQSGGERRPWVEKCHRERGTEI